MTDASSNHADPASPAGSGGQTREEFLKRAGAGAAVLFAGSGFAGLGASARAARNGRNARAAVSGTVTVRYWGQGPERVAWAKRIKYFNVKYPNVKVVSQLLQKNGYDEFPALLTQIAAGHAPDVMRVLNYQPTQLVAQGNALMPLDDFIKNDKTLDVPDFVPVAWAAGKVGGKQFAVPQNGEPYNVHYNKDAFAKAGIEDPWAQYQRRHLERAVVQGSREGAAGEGRPQVRRGLGVVELRRVRVHGRREDPRPEAEAADPGPAVAEDPPVPLGHGQHRQDGARPERAVGELAPVPSRSSSSGCT